MFTGIITDRFSNEREKLQEINHDNANCCFICGKSREEIERQKFKFEEHIHGAHSYLNYIFYIDYLHQKKEHAPDALSMTERQVHALVVQKDQEQKWMPCYSESDPVQEVKEEILNEMAEMRT